MKRAVAFAIAGAVGAIRVTVSPDEFDRVLSALKEKYGEPTDVSTETVSTKGGLRALNTLAKWDFVNGIVTAQRYAGALDTSAILFTTSAYAEEAVRRNNARTKRDAKKL